MTYLLKAYTIFAKSFSFFQYVTVWDVSLFLKFDFCQKLVFLFVFFFSTLPFAMFDFLKKNIFAESNFSPHVTVCDISRYLLIFVISCFPKVIFFITLPI